MIGENLYLFSLNLPLRHEVARLIVWHAVSTVAYLLAADLVSRLPSCRLSDDHQPVIMTRNRFSTPRLSLEFIPIKSWVTKGSGAPGNCAGHSRAPSRDRGRPPSTGGSGLSPCDTA